MLRAQRDTSFDVGAIIFQRDRRSSGDISDATEPLRCVFRFDGFVGVAHGAIYLAKKGVVEPRRDCDANGIDGSRGLATKLPFSCTARRARELFSLSRCDVSAC